MDHMFFNFFELDQDDEKTQHFQASYQKKCLKDGEDAVVFLSFEELREIKAQSDNQAKNLPTYLFSEMKLLQFYLKHLQEKGLFSIDGGFDYSSIDESEFRKFNKCPSSIC